MNGTNPVATTEEFWRVISARVVVAGSSGLNDGTLTCTIDGREAAVVYAQNVGNLDPQFTVPPGHVGYVFDWRASATTIGGQIAYGAVRLMLRPPSQLFYPYEEHFFGGERERSGPLVAVDPGTDITIRSWTEGGGASRWVSSSYKIALFPAEA